MIIEEIKKAVKKAGYAVSEIDVDYPEREEFGDFTTNVAMKLAKKSGKNPRGLAQKIVSNIKASKYIKKADVAGPGFINIFVTPRYWQDNLAGISKEKDNYGRGKTKKEKVQVEFISANPTGQLHLGHARNGYIGDVLANVFRFRGYKTTKEFYINDAGNQIISLGHSMLEAAGFEPKDVTHYGGDYVDTWAKKNKKYIVENQNNPKKIGARASLEILGNIRRTVLRMGIKFDVWFSEQKLYKNNEVQKSIDFLMKKGLTYENEGATWFKTSKFGDSEDRVLIKSDGKPTYITPDIAYHYDKFVVRKFDKVINVLGTDHHGYVPRLKAAVSSMGFGDRLDVVLLQLVRLVKKGKEYRMSKRKGLFVTVDDLLDLISGADASDVARFFFLFSSYDTHMAFDLDLAKERSEKNPVFYVKYAYARLSGILRYAPSAKGGSVSGRNKLPKSDLSLLKQKEEINLIKQLLMLPEITKSIIEEGKYPVHKLTHYSIEIAKSFHAFYDKCRVIDETNPELSSARLELVKATKTVLKIVGEDLIGIKMPEKM